jgi:hypothetical protein
MPVFIRTSPKLVPAGTMAVALVTGLISRTGTHPLPANLPVAKNVPRAVRAMSYPPRSRDRFV